MALALVAQVFGWLLITRSLPKMPAVETSVLLLAQPALTVTWGVVLLGEALAPLQAAGEPLYLVEDNPTAECIARHIFEHASAAGLPVARVTMWETPTSSATYSRPSP